MLLVSVKSQVKLLSWSVERREKDRKLVKRSRGWPAPKLMPPSPFVPLAPPQSIRNVGVGPSGVLRVIRVLAAETESVVGKPGSLPVEVSVTVRNPPMAAADATVLSVELFSADRLWKVVSPSIVLVTVAACVIPPQTINSGRIRTKGFTGSSELRALSANSHVLQAEMVRVRVAHGKQPAVRLSPRLSESVQDGARHYGEGCYICHSTGKHRRVFGGEESSFNPAKFAQTDDCAQYPQRGILRGTRMRLL